MRLKFLLPVLLLLAAAPASAQAPDPIQFIIAPETPGPNETVLIEVRGIGTFLGEANIVWRKDGVVEKQGVGERTFSFTTGSLGSGTRIQVSILRQGQATITRDFVFVPSLVNLVWEADTYTPPFYRGKALYSPGSSLRVTAFPVVFANGAQVPAGNLSYQWLRNGNPVTGSSGTGRSTISLIGDQFQEAESIGVEVYLGTSKVARGDINIPAQPPLVLLYSRDPLRGIAYEQALPASISLIGKEITVQAEPYFFSNASRVGGALSYQWTLNGEAAAGPDSERGILTLRQTGEGSGGSVVSVTVQNSDGARLTQQAAALLEIVFGSQANNGLGAALSAAVANFTRLAQTPTPIEYGLGTTPTTQTGNFQQQWGNTNWAPTTQTGSTNIQQSWVPAGLNANFGTAPSFFGTGNLPPYQPLEPIPGLNQSGSADFGQLLSNLFRILISLGALLAVVMLVVSGIEYMVSDVARVKLGAKERAWGAILGLVILAGSVLILQTLNPKLLNFTNLLNPAQPNIRAGTSLSADGGIVFTSSLDSAQLQAARDYYSKNIGYLPAGAYEIKGGIAYYSGVATSPEVQTALKELTSQCSSGNYTRATWLAAGGTLIATPTGVGQVVGATFITGSILDAGATAFSAATARVVAMPGAESGQTIQACVAYAKPI